MKKLYQRLYDPAALHLPEADAQGRVYFFDNAKFLLMLLVVLGHFLQEILQQSYTAKAAYLWIYSFHMPVFVFLSGYMAKSALRRERFCIEKATSYCLLYGLLYCALFCIRKYIGHAENYSFALLGAEYSSWYLLSSAFWLGISYLLRDIGWKKLLPIAVLAGLLIGLDSQAGAYLSFSRTIIYYPFFIAGLAMEKEKLANWHRRSGLRLLALLLLVFAGLFLLLRIGAIDLENIKVLYGSNSYESIPLPYPALRRALWYIAAPLLGLSFLMLVPAGKTFFTHLGARTMTVYFLHSIIVYLLRYLGARDFLLQTFLHTWKILWVALAIALPFLLSAKPLSWPFDKVLGIRQKR